MGSLPHNIINTLVNAGYSNPIIDATEWGVPSTSNGSLGLSYTEQANLMTQGGGAASGVQGGVWRLVLRGAARVVVLDDDMSDLVVAKYAVPRSRVVVIRNGVDPSFALVPALRQRDIDEAPLRVVFVGRLAAQKNVARLLDALTLTHTVVRVRLVGDGFLRRDLKAQAARMELPVRFEGELTGAPLLEALAWADVFVLPRTGGDAPGRDRGDGGGCARDRDRRATDPRTRGRRGPSRARDAGRTRRGPRPGRCGPRPACTHGAGRSPSRRGVHVA
jgi:hypothetical protein